MFERAELTAAVITAVARSDEAASRVVAGLGMHITVTTVTIVIGSYFQ